MHQQAPLAELPNPTPPPPQCSSSSSSTAYLEVVTFQGVVQGCVAPAVSCVQWCTCLDECCGDLQGQAVPAGSRETGGGGTWHKGLKLHLEKAKCLSPPAHLCVEHTLMLLPAHAPH
jgi:hypothetical protein